MNKLYTALITWMNNAGVIWIFALMFLICADIGSRSLFDAPIRGVPEIVSLSLVACVFLQLAFAANRKRLTRAEVFSNYLKKRQSGFESSWDILLAAISMVIIALIAVGTWPDFWKAFKNSEFVGVEGLYTFSVSPIKFIIVSGALITALEYARQCLTGIYSLSVSHRFKFFLPVTGIIFLSLFILLDALTGANEQVIGISMIGLVLILIFAGLPISVALLMVGFTGIGLIKGDFAIATRTIAMTAQGTVSEYVFATVPLFVLMGMFVNVSEIGKDSFKAAQQVFGQIYGGLGIATVAANSLFAAITGISIASAAIFTKIAVPEMVRQGYRPKFAVGLTAGSSVLGMLIPPSLLLIIYAVIAEVSIGKLFLAAVIPGLLLAMAFCCGVMLMARYWPAFVGDTIYQGSIDEEDRINPFLAMTPVFLLILLVLGGIYGGIFTPTEAGAAGALAAMLITLFRKRLDAKNLWKVILETGQVTVTILFLIISASAFSRMLTLTGLPSDIAAYLGQGDIGMMGFLIGYLFLLILLGTVLDSTSILLILLPLVLPIVSALGGDLIWFGIVTVIGVEIGLMTPPLGLSVYVIKSSLDDESISLSDIFSGAFPFVLITLGVTLLLMMYPALSLILIQ